ncbi:MAG: arylsulfatase [Dysgonamonadaceae bacterium]|jgi:arylsulfatase A-like enzyme|nr:arylsulfatase [Dysgonamonadaceae bacterium]
MNIKHFGIGAMLALAGCAPKTEQKAPNIIFILADDLGYGDISALNPESKIITPNIDRIARNGVTFTDAHSNSSVSTPTRYGILTGRYAWRTPLKAGVLNGYSKAMIPQDRTTMAGMLQQQGYHTACFGKWHLGWDWANIDAGIDNIDYSRPITNGPITLGFDYFYGFSGSLDMPPYVYVENDMPTALPDRLTVGNNIPVGREGSDGSFWREGPTGSDFDHLDCQPNLNRRVIKYIGEKARSKQPFFVYYPMPSPHTPILPTEEFQGKSGLNTYADFVLMVDKMVGDIIDALEKNGILDNTILVFTADNGCSPWADFPFLLEHGHNPNYVFRGAKADLYEGGHRVPCVVQWPARIEPQVINQTICLIDFMATFAEISGYSLQDNEAEDSFSLLPALLDANNNELIREATVHHSINGDFSIRTGKWKLLLAPGSGGWSFPRPGDEPDGAPSVQLYDVIADVGETVNLQDQYPEVVKELKALLTKYINDGRSTPGAIQKNEGEFPWRQL